MRHWISHWLPVLVLIITGLVSQKFGRSLLASWDYHVAEWQLSDEDRHFQAATSHLRTFHKRLGKPRPQDWLATQFEPGQSFAQYVSSDPVRLTSERCTVYVQPLGKLTEQERQLIQTSAEFLELYYVCPVRVLPAIPETVIPSSARRFRTKAGITQFDASFVLDQVLKPRLPDDALAYIAFTATDLYPARDWNFVFGLASIEDRVGIWSVARLRDTSAGSGVSRKMLTRTLKLATHETGHMLSMGHCTGFECNMCGSMTVEETDRYPLCLCPVCLAKVHWATQVDPAGRFRNLADFCEKHGLDEEGQYYLNASELAGAES